MPPTDLSVIIPSRNPDEDLLARAVRSALGFGATACVWFDHTDDETWALFNWERVCRFDIPDGATIGSGRVGKIGAQNKALGLATRKYVIFHGDDDYIGAGAVELVDYLESNPSMAFAYGSQQYMGGRTDLVRPRQYVGDELYQGNLPLNGIVFRREVMLAVGGYRDILGDPMRNDQPEDYDLLLRIHEAGHVGASVDTSEPVLFYTLSHSRSWAKMQDNADEVYRAFKAHHPKYTGGRL